MKRKKRISIEKISEIIATPGNLAAHQKPLLFVLFSLTGVILSGISFYFPQTSAQARSNAPASAGVAFAPTVPNTQPAPALAPTGMVWIPGGEFSMGERRILPAWTWSECARLLIPGRSTEFMSTDFSTDVSNVQFAEFVKATGYVTVAEKTPTQAKFPGVPRENLYAGGVVFTPPNHGVPLKDQFQWWSYVKGANWRHASGPNSSIKGKKVYPVVQIADADAQAYARWAHKRLPTEADWEFSARGGLAGKPYVWGERFKPKGKWMANTFQGHFPDQDSGADGFAGSSPVGKFAPNGYGLYDMVGNVWQWTSDWYRPDYYAELGKLGGVARNPQGPESPFDPAEPNERKKVHRGGSFLCTDQYCSRYMVGTRGKGEVSSGTNHLGFRCVSNKGIK